MGIASGPYLELCFMFGRSCLISRDYNSCQGFFTDFLHCFFTECFLPNALVSLEINDLRDEKIIEKVESAKSG